jgi:putative heme-binding domain-containing protein
MTMPSFIPIHWLHCLIAVIPLCVFNPSSPALADDETQVLQLLVETLNQTDDPKIQESLMRGIISGLEGRRGVTAPENWASLNAKLSQHANPEIRNLALQLAQVFGDADAKQFALKTVRDKNASLQSRRQALRSLLNQQNEEASNLLEFLLEEPKLCLDAIRGYAAVENATGPAVLTKRYSKFSEEQRRAVIETLASRQFYAEQLLAALKANTIPRTDIPVHVARSLNEILGQSFVDYYGDVKPVTTDRIKIIAKYKRMVSGSALENANASRGRLVFKKSCASCHVLYDDGAKIGPDLTGSNRANLDYILLNSVAPSYDVPESYQMVLIHTVDGRLINGVITEEDATRVVLKSVEQPRMVIAKADIETRKVSEKSMMPEGQLDQMKPQEVRDLIKYLQTTEQVEMAK